MFFLFISFPPSKLQNFFKTRQQSQTVREGFLLYKIARILPLLTYKIANCLPKGSTTMKIALSNLDIVGQDAGLDDLASDDVGVHVGRGPPVLEVSLFFLFRHPGDPGGAAAVRDAIGELLDGGGLVEAGEAASIIRSTIGVVGGDMLLLLTGGTEAFQGLDDLIISTVLPHDLGREIGVAAGSVPVPRDGFRVE